MSRSKTILTTTIEYDKTKTHRFYMKMEWDSSKPCLLAIMLVPSASDGICVDASTNHVLENAVFFNYGSIVICNLFSFIGDYKLKQNDTHMADRNLKAILAAVTEATTVVYCPGRGKAALKCFQERERIVLSALSSCECSLQCIADKYGNMQFHPLSPRVRRWRLVPLPQQSNNASSTEDSLGNAR